MTRSALLVADAARARIYSFVRTVEPDGVHDELDEVVDLVDEARRQRPSELFSDNSGASHTGHHGFAFDDHRQTHLDQFDAKFAGLIVENVTRVIREGHHDKLLLVASSRMLGALRVACASLQRTVAITELERDYTKLTTPQLRDQLADLHLLPPRTRLAASR